MEMDIGSLSAELDGHVVRIGIDALPITAHGHYTAKHHYLFAHSRGPLAWTLLAPLVQLFPSPILLVMALD
jgi:hypothetical protein